MGRAGMTWASDALVNLAEAPHLLVICGTNGIGKTALLRGLKRFLSACRISAWSAGWWGHPMDLRYAAWQLWANLDGNRSEEERLSFLELIEADVLLLDDVGAETDRYRSGLPLSNLGLLLGLREKKWTALTTNYLPENWVGTEAVPGRFGKRVGDRLFRNSTIVPLRHTPSWALKKGKA